MVIVNGPGPAGGGETLETSLQPVNQQTYRNDSRRAHRIFSVGPPRPIKDLPSNQSSNAIFTIQEMLALVFDSMPVQLIHHPVKFSDAS